MRIAYLDCASGISGDMTLAALIDAGVDLAAIQSAVDSLGLPGCRIVPSEVTKRGFRALQITVERELGHVHRHLSDILKMIDRSALSAPQREMAARTFGKLAEAEAKVHGTTVEKVHFHEVGAVDSIADIVGAAVGFDLLGIERVVCSPVPTGWGFVDIAHGRCAIPAPATAELLAGVPLAERDVEGELTTPTGAAIVATIADAFGPLPAMVIERIGYGAGQRDFEHPNLLRLIVGEAVPTAEAVSPGEFASASGESPVTRPRTEAIVLLETNVDDMPGTAIGHCMDRLWAAGALDVTLAAIQMKKGRPGVLISVQAKPAQTAELEAILFEETTTLGVRHQTLERTALARRPHEVQTPWGAVAGKTAYLPDGSPRFAPEYEACRQVAERAGVALAEVVEAARRAFQQSESD